MMDIVSKPKQTLSDNYIPVIFVSGMSGAGMSSSLKLLEDLGYETVDNLPFTIFSALINNGDFIDRPLAVGIDSRNRDFSVDNIRNQIEKLKNNQQFKVTLLFMDCEDERLLDRFKVNRRRHPKAIDRPVRDGIRYERKHLMALREHADLVIDTSDLSVKDLKRQLEGQFSLESHEEMSVSVISFSFRKGVPREADMVFDVRFLQNPYYDETLRLLTGKDDNVVEFIKKDDSYGNFWKNITTMVEPLLDRFKEEGRSYLTFAIGCTGGRHRSVFIAESLYKWLKQLGWPATILHRELKTGKNK
jgi:RNase adapter protein RapZ